MPDFIHIHPDDNVAVALTAIAAGTLEPENDPQIQAALAALNQEP